MTGERTGAVSLFPSLHWLPELGLQFLLVPRDSIGDLHRVDASEGWKCSWI